MSIIRAERKNQFYTLPNATIEDDRLSWEARGMLVYLLSKPDHWKVQIIDLINRTKNALGKRSGRDKVYSILKELRMAGYLYMTRLRTGGEFHGVDYEISESPDLEAGAAFIASLEQGPSPLPEKPDTVAPDTAKPDPAKPEDIDKTERASKTEKAVKPSGDPGEAKADGGPEWVDGMPGNYPRSPDSATYAVWMAYAKAFKTRHLQWPVYNGTVGGQIAQLIKRIGADAAQTATYYVEKVDQALVVENCHPVGILLKQCESYSVKATQHTAVLKRQKAAKSSVVQPVPVVQTAQPVEVQPPAPKRSGVAVEARALLRQAARLRPSQPGAEQHA